MGNAPERISLLPEHDWAWCEGSPVTEPERIEYVRADRIEALEAENARLREALEWYGEQAAILAKATLDSEFAKQRLKRDMGGRARAALKQEGGE